MNTLAAISASEWVVIIGAITGGVLSILGASIPVIKALRGNADATRENTAALKQMTDDTSGDAK